MPTDYLKKAAAAFTGIVVVVPSTIVDGIIALFLLMLIDTVTGAWLAARCGQARSRSLRVQLISKSLQYASFIGIGFVVKISFNQWAVATTFVSLCQSIEVLSILENAIRLEDCGGAPLGPARPYINRLRKYFATNNESTDESTNDSQVSQKQ